MHLAADGVLQARVVRPVHAVQRGGFVDERHPQAVDVRQVARPRGDRAALGNLQAGRGKHHLRPRRWRRLARTR